MKKYIVLICCTLSFYSQAQEQLPFERIQEFYLEGDAFVTGNAILGADKEAPFTDTNTINDMVKMTYIDIDKDNGTFSSSQATVQIPDNGTVIYAGLYWSGTYSYEEGVKRQRGNRIVYKGKKNRMGNIAQVQFKMPETNYQPIEGTVLYDGIYSENHTENAPYVCYKDVTSIVQGHTNVNGIYTLANIKATQGFITGGSCAGWLLYIVYKTPDATPKYITTYHGFEYVNKNRVEVTFENFKSVLEGEVKTAITMATLEGDSHLYRDQSAIWYQDKRSFIPLENAHRAKHNFFNSSISKNGIPNMDRMPASTNTLGFDIVQMPVENPDNAIIANGMDNVRLRFTTRADRYYLFFTAFTTEIDSDYYASVTGKQESPVVTTATVPVQNPVVTIEQPEEEIAVPTPVVEAEIATPDPIVEEPVKTPEEKEETIQEIAATPEEVILKRLIAKPTSRLDGITPGYYLVTNVFSQPDLAQKWKLLLERKGYQPKILLNPENNWEYVYINHALRPADLIDQLLKAEEQPFLENLWVFKINVD